MNVVPGLMYSSDHEWVRVEGNKVYVGITNYAQLQLGDVVFVEMPEEDAQIEAGEIMCAIESVKTAADIYCPVSGTITEVNNELEDAPENVNEEPYESWIAVIEMSNPEELDDLMSETEYADFCASEEA